MDVIGYVDEALDLDSERIGLHHPHVVLRVAGLPYSLVRHVATGKAQAELRRLDELRSESEDLATRACGCLEAAVACDDLTKEERRALLDLKRKIFNRKSHDIPASLLTRFTPAEKACIEQAGATVNEFARIEASFDETFESEVKTSSERLRELCFESEEFLRGLAYTAPIVASDLLSSRSAPQKFTGKKGRQLDIGLFNYFIRAASKVSPLTYFTPVHVARLTDGSSDGPIDLGGRDVLSRAELGRQALGALLERVIKDLQVWGTEHPLVLNPTLAFNGTVYSYTDIFAGGPRDRRTWGTYPPAINVAATPRIAALQHIFGGNGSTRSLTCREIFEEAAELFGRDWTLFTKYAAQATRAGLLVPQIDLYEQEDVAAHLLAVLRERSPEAGGYLAQVLQAISRFESAPHAERLKCSREIEQQYSALSPQAATEERAGKGAPLFYEDCYLAGAPLDVPASAAGQALDDFHRFSALLPLMDYNHLLQSVTAAIFRRRYGENGVANAAECLETIATESAELSRRIAFLPMEQQQRELESISTTASELVRQKRLFLDELYERMQARHDVELDDAFLDKYANALPLPLRSRSTSYTVIGQVCEPGEEQRFVLNLLYSGHSMLMSRFLRGLDEEDIALVRDYLTKLAGGDEPVELPGVFGFNANLHPRLLDAELALDGRHASYRETEKISLSSLSITYDAARDRLAVGGPGGVSYAVHYFGFLNLMAVPSTYRTLGCMHLQGLVPDLWQSLYFGGYISPERGITHLARATYRSLVLSRRSTMCAFAELPAPDSPAPAFFRGLHDKLRDLGLHGDQYVRLLAQREDFSGQQLNGGVMSATASKPALLSLDLPLTVNSLQRRLQRRQRGILLQESLPGIGESGVLWRGRRHACEMQFELSQMPTGGALHRAGHPD